MKIVDDDDDELDETRTLPDKHVFCVVCDESDTIYHRVGKDQECDHSEQKGKLLMNDKNDCYRVMKS